MDFKKELCRLCLFIWELFRSARPGRDQPRCFSWVLYNSPAAADHPGTVMAERTKSRFRYRGMDEARKKQASPKRAFGEARPKSGLGPAMLAASFSRAGRKRRSVFFQIAHDVEKKTDGKKDQAQE